MTYLFSDEGRLALRALASRPILYAFDFDGTLARISPDRDTVKLSQSIYEGLSELANRLPCAIVSGRALSDLASRVDGVVPHLIGNHGLESPLTSPATLIRAENICEGWMKRLGTEFIQPLKNHGAEVENKRYTLTLHYRGANEPARVRMALILLLDQLAPTPRLIFGKASVNVLPPGEGGKGPAALALMRHLRQTGLFFIGDDETDEDVFELSEGLVMGVRVGPHEKSRAKYFINHQGEINDILHFLIHCIDRTPESYADGESDVSDTRKRAHDL
ncbi:MAG: trehalose-phosphatase [Nitrospiraceae bacterium]